jgi:hypothetical protein
MVMVLVRDRNMNHLEGKCNKFEINGKNKNIVDLYRGIKESKEGYQP